MASGLLPARLYLEPDAFTHERQALFAHAWQMLGRADALAATGDYVCQILGGWPVFAARSDAGIAAFHNQCRHQGLPVVDAGAGRRTELRCRYHGWTYDLAGRFVQAPPKVAPSQPHGPECNLPTVRIERRHGLLFIHVEADAAPFDDAPALAGVEALRPRGDATVDIDANWKAVVEHLLDEAPQAGRHWLWPTLVIDHAADARIIHQVIPRTHLRTRLVLHLLCADDTPARLEDGIATTRSGAEARQQALAAGSPMPPTTPLGRQFQSRVAAIHG
ncbi:Rieske (2Fe-2S) protein [Vineibacter terrae]|uniref:Rieske (2Fe-2S) protein n=1 Tax=Vineibacter terrae TaxID=2586908 RepID=A0A5C8PTJ1_9HYPH|nr:Rieske (2Fe-2S) protein [Vineibacter terrae]TXL80281.1 Rieske (2Fe-2S) protein [Vineibacter terrae]